MTTVDDRPDAAADSDETERGEGRMTFLEHLDELRRRLMFVVFTVLGAILVAFFFADQLLHFLLYPVEQAVAPAKLAVLSPAEGFMNKMKAAFVGAIFLSLPVLFYQLWAFVSPGLYRREKRWVIPVLTFGTSMFLAGAAFCYWVALPSAAKFLIDQSAGSNFSVVVSVDSAFGFSSKLLLGMGLVFEMPLIVFALAKMGIVTPAFLWKHIRIAVFLIFLVAAIITPTPDWITCTIFAAPMIGLYLLSILVAWLAAPRAPKSDAASA